MKSFKSFWAYTGIFYKVVIFLYCLPVTIVCFLIQNKLLFNLPEMDDHDRSLYCVALLGYGILAAEILMDGFAFGGINAKDSRHGLYFKTAAKGEKVFESILKFDVLRRGITIAGVLAMNLLISFWTNGNIEPALITASFQIAGCCWMISSIMICVGRFFMNPWVKLLWMYLAWIMLLLIIPTLEWLEMPAILQIVIFVVLGMISNWALLVIGKSRMRGKEDD